MSIECLVEWELDGETEVLRDFNHHISHRTWPGNEPGPPWWEARDCLSYVTGDVILTGETCAIKGDGVEGRKILNFKFYGEASNW
jgi:hypothetical protein